MALLTVGLSACGSDSIVPDAARVTCTSDGISVETPLAAPKRDGLHVVIVNQTGAKRSLSLRSDDEKGPRVVVVPPGETEEVVDLAPGLLAVGCDDLALATPAQPSESLEIVDPEGLWVSTALPCPEQISTREDHFEGTKGTTSDPLEAARQAFGDYELDSDDVVEPAGYPEAEVPRFRLVSNGTPSLTVELSDDGEGKWLAGWITGCTSLEDSG